jgi:hypothetical protein
MGTPFKQQVKADKFYSPQFFNWRYCAVATDLVINVRTRGFRYDDVLRDRRFEKDHN